MHSSTTRIESAISQLDAKFDSLTSRINTLENKAESLETKMAVFSTTVQHTEETAEQSLTLSKAVVKENKILRRRLEVAENQLRGANVRIVGFPDGAEGTDLLSFIEDWVPKILKINTEEDPIYVEQAYRIPAKKEFNREQRRTVVIKLSSERDHDRVLRAARLMKDIKFNENRVLFFPDLCPESQAKRRALNTIKKDLLEMNLEASLQYPAKLKVSFQDKMYVFWDLRDAERFALSRKKESSENKQLDLDEEDSI